MKRVAAAMAVMLSAGWAGSVPAYGWDSPDPDVVLYCSRPLAASCRVLARDFGAAHHIGVHLFLAPPDGLRGLIAHRARADVVLADAPTIAALAERGLVTPASIVTLGADPFVLASRNGAPESPGAGGAVVLPDATSAASFDGPAVLKAAFPGATPAASGVADTDSVTAELHAAPDAVGLLTATDAAGAGLTQTAALAVPPMRLAGAVVALRQSRNAQAFLDFVAAPDGRATLARAGVVAAP